MANTSLSFIRVSGALSTVSNVETGAIYFSAADHTIAVGTGENTLEKYYGGNVSNVSFADKKLTISYFDGQDVVLDFTDTASATGVNALLKGLAGRIDGLEADSHTHSNSAELDKIADGDVAKWNAKQDALANADVLDDITADQVTAWDEVADAKDGYDTHVADAVKHITAEERTAWNAKQDALSDEDLARIAAVDNKADSTTVAALDKYVKGDADASTDAAKKGLEGRIADLEAADVQDALDDDQLAAVNSGITSEKVGNYDEHIADEDIHITSDERTAWNAYATSKQDALSAEDLARIAAVDDKANTADLGTAAAKNVLTGTIADSTSEDLVTAAQVKAYAAGVVGAMHFRGVVDATGDVENPASGDICLVGTAEYVYDGSAWVLFGDEGAYEAAGTAQGLIDALAGEASSTSGADVVVTVKSSKGQVSEVSVDSSVLAGRVKALEDADAADINADQIDAWDAVAAKKSDYDAHLANGDVHVTTEDKEEWSGKQDALANADVLAGITAEQVSNWDAAATANHSHDNKDLLDTYTQTEANLADAVSKKHSHENADELAKIAEGDVEKWNNKQDAIAENTYDEYGAAATAKSDVIGTSTDAADADTINGAKAYADAAVAAGMVWKQF